MKLSGIWLLFFWLAVVSCEPDVIVRSETDTGGLVGPVTVDGQTFVDGYGREVIFNGINLVNKNTKEHHLGPILDEQVYRDMKTLGFNVVRLGIFWDELEPEPGVFNEKYLDGLEDAVKKAGNHGVFVILDMHQDLFSDLYGEGAPSWATMSENDEHVKGAVWSDAYLISPAVQKAWDHFWNNSLASDSAGLQDHYAWTWKKVAERFKNNDVVVGYDLMNEPFVGSEAQMYLPVLFKAFSEVIKREEGEDLPVSEIAQMWQNVDTRMDVLKRIASRERYKQVVQAVYTINSKFEKGLLQTFYQKVADSIRKVDQQKILFLNHSYFCNMGVPTALEPLKKKDGSVDKEVAYAPHAYDLLVEPKKIDKSNLDRLSFIYETIAASGKRMNMPVIISEWGAFGKELQQMEKLIKKQFEIFEQYHFGNIYWDFNAQIKKRSFYSVLSHLYPVCISGKLNSYHQDGAGLFTCSWVESEALNNSTYIFIPDLNQVDVDHIVLEPEGSGIIIESMKKSNGGFIVVEPMKKTVKREIRIMIRKESKDIPLVNN